MAPGALAAAVASPQIPLASTAPPPTCFVIAFVDFPQGLFPWPHQAGSMGPCVVQTVLLLLKSVGFKWSLGAVLAGRDPQDTCRSVSTRRHRKPGWPGESRVPIQGLQHATAGPKAQPASPVDDIVAPAAPSRAPTPRHTPACEHWSLLIAGRLGQSQKLRARGPAPASACTGEVLTYFVLTFSLRPLTSCSFPPSFYGEFSQLYYFNFHLIFFTWMIFIRFSFSFICIVVHLIFTGIYLKAIKTHLSNRNYTYLIHINFSFSIMFPLFFLCCDNIWKKFNNLKKA